MGFLTFLSFFDLCLWCLCLEDDDVLVSSTMVEGSVLGLPVSEIILKCYSTVYLFNSDCNHQNIQEVR